MISKFNKQAMIDIAARLAQLLVQPLEPWGFGSGVLVGTFMTWYGYL